jgi:hypothetical protein
VNGKWIKIIIDNIKNIVLIICSFVMVWNASSSVDKQGLFERGIEDHVASCE